MGSTSIDWDEVQVVKSPKHKQVEVGFKGKQYAGLLPEYGSDPKGPGTDWDKNPEHPNNGGPEPQPPEEEIPPADDQFTECGGQDCAGLSSHYLSVVSGGNVISFLDVTGNGNLSTANWPKNNDVYQDPPYDDQGYNTHRCADPEGNLSNYYYTGFTGYNFNYAYNNINSQMESYIGSNFCRAQSKLAPAWDGIAPLGNLRSQGHLLTWGSVRGLDGLANIGSGGSNPGGVGSYIQNCGFTETTFHFLVSVDSSPSASDTVSMGLNYRASLSTYKADTGPILDPTTGPYASIYRPSASIYVQLRGDGTMRFLAPGANDEVGRWVSGTPAANSVHLVSVRVSGGIRNQFVDRVNNVTFGSCEVDGNIEVLTEADTANSYYRRQIGGGVMNGSEDDFWSAYDYQGEPLQGVQFSRQGSNGVQANLLAISNNKTFDDLFRRSFTDYALPDYCTRIP